MDTISNYGWKNNMGFLIKQQEYYYKIWLHLIKEAVMHESSNIIYEDSYPNPIGTVKCGSMVYRNWFVA